MIVRYILKGLLLPPAGNLVLLLLGFLCWRSYPRFARLCVGISVLSLWIFSTPWFAGHLVAPLERRYPVLTQDYQCEDAGAIVVLGGGSTKYAPEYGDGRGMKQATVQRVRYAATLAKRCGKPLLVTGGRVFGDEEESEADIMASALENEFGVAVRWREDRSRTTEENAVYATATLQKEGIASMVLVTSAFHMPRSIQSFGKHGMNIVPAPTGVSSIPEGAGKLSDWIPGAEALLKSRYALHEYLGMLVYKLLY